jgi:hypothetical protein
MADTYFEFYSDLVYLDSFNGEWITESGGSTPAIKVGGVWKETTSQKIKVGGAWKEIVGCKI